VVSSVAGKHNSQVQTVVGLICPCSTLREKEIYMDSESVVFVARVYVAGLYSNALVLLLCFIWCSI